MTWIAGSEILLGIVTLGVWVMALRLLSGRMRMSNMGFVLLPSLFLMGAIGGLVLVLNGVGLL